MHAQPTSLGFSGGPSSNPNFSDLIVKLLARIDVRRADSAEQREAIFRLRYEAYRREGVIPADSSATFFDAYDQTPNAYLFGLYIEGKLASSLRIHVASREYPDCPTLEVFPEYLQPELDAGKVIIDPTRFVADEALARLHRELPYATLRLCWLAAAHFGSALGLAAVRVEHQEFYRRTFGHRVICGPRPYPLLAKPVCLMAVYYPSVAEQVHRRLPFLRSTLFERRMLFERGSAGDRITGQAGVSDALAPDDLAVPSAG